MYSDLVTSGNFRPPMRLVAIALGILFTLVIGVASWWDMLVTVISAPTTISSFLDSLGLKLAGWGPFIFFALVTLTAVLIFQPLLLQQLRRRFGESELVICFSNEPPYRIETEDLNDSSPHRVRQLLRIGVRPSGIKTIKDVGIRRTAIIVDSSFRLVSASLDMALADVGGRATHLNSGYEALFEIAKYKPALNRFYLPQHIPNKGEDFQPASHELTFLLTAHGTDVRDVQFALRFRVANGAFEAELVTGVEEINALRNLPFGERVNVVSGASSVAPTLQWNAGVAPEKPK